MDKDKSKIVELSTAAKSSHLYSEDLKPLPTKERHWGVWDLTAIWVGMAVCIPTYLLASYMIKDGFSWLEAIIIIALGNLIVTIPMVLNGHAGVKYGVPFPVIGRASFGTKGIHLPSLLRGLVACGWFGIQCWIGGLAVYSIGVTVLGLESESALSIGKFIGFAIFWLLNVYFIWNGMESIRWIEKSTAPILLIMGVLLIIWGATNVGGFSKVLKNSEQYSIATAAINNKGIAINTITDKDGKRKAKEYRLINNGKEQAWKSIPTNHIIPYQAGNNVKGLNIQFRSDDKITSSKVKVQASSLANSSTQNRFWKYLMWLTAMVGFWATMAISIADITRHSKSQKEQVMGQFIGLPGTMILYSFVGIFVTCAAATIFGDVLVLEDSPWDPVTLIGKLNNSWVIVLAQIFMIIATLSTNIAANVIAPANAFSNLNPKNISFRTGGIITAVIGILICPWWLLDEISGLLIFVSSFLGPILAVLIADYFFIRKTELNTEALFLTDGEYAYQQGYNIKAFVAFTAGVLTALVGFFVPALNLLYNTSWFSSFAVTLVVYCLLSYKNKKKILANGVIHLFILSNF